MEVDLTTHLPVETIVEQQVVGHPDSLGLHRVSLSIVVVPYVTIVVIADFLLAVRRCRATDRSLRTYPV